MQPPHKIVLRHWRQKYQRAYWITDEVANLIIHYLKTYHQKKITTMRLAPSHSLIVLDRWTKAYKMHQRFPRHLKNSYIIDHLRVGYKHMLIDNESAFLYSRMFPHTSQKSQSKKLSPNKLISYYGKIMVATFDNLLILDLHNSTYKPMLYVSPIGVTSFDYITLFDRDLAFIGLTL